MIDILSNIHNNMDIFTIFCELFGLQYFTIFLRSSRYTFVPMFASLPFLVYLLFLQLAGKPCIFHLLNLSNNSVAYHQQF